MTTPAQQVLDFWFDELEPAQWWKKDQQLDAQIRQRFAALHQTAARGELADWRSSCDGRLAEILLLDQFSRNLFRGDPRAWHWDGMALVLAQEAIGQGCEQALADDINRLAFLYMPFMHSESREIQQQSVQLFSRKGLEHNLDFAIRHQEIIERFGRYPHRNAVLGRASTAAELEFLQQPNSSF